jgi:serine protease
VLSVIKKLFAPLAFAVISILLVGQSAAPANAQVASSVYPQSTLAAGILVQYPAGQAPTTANGDPVGENAAGVNLAYDSAIGLNWYSLKFDAPMSANQAYEIAQRVKADPRVEDADVNAIFSIEAQLIGSASPVPSLKATTALLTDQQLLPRVQLSWQKPASLGGGKVIGYRIEQSDASGANWKVVVANTKSTELQRFITENLVVGSVAKFRVRAITKNGSTVKIGTPSKTISIVPTTIPQIPILTNTTTSAAKPLVTWKPQSLEQKGGLTVTYTVTAKSPGQPNVTCTGTGTSCELIGLVPNVTYALSILAKNSRGYSGERLPFTATDPQIDKQWHLNGAHGINVNAAWKRTNGDASVVVAVIDSGITAHPDLAGQTVPGYDFVSDTASSADGDGRDADPSDPGDGGGGDPSSWHGTHVSGLIAAAANDMGGVGVAPGVRVQMLRALGSQGGESRDLAAAINWAAGINVPGVPNNPTPAKVINMSLGTDTPQRCDAATQSAVDAVKAAGVTMITAAGNTNSDAFWSYPGNCFGTINVGATGFNGDRAFYSNYGLGVDISAPGGDSRNSAGAPDVTNGRIFSTSNDGTLTPGNPGYAYQEGTSMAAPILAGVVALMYSVEPTLTYDEVWQILKSTVTPFASGTVCQRGVGTNSQLCGAGIVNAGAAVEAAIKLR